jgi:hypothetical protein
VVHCWCMYDSSVKAKKKNPSPNLYILLYQCTSSVTVYSVLLSIMYDPDIFRNETRDETEKYSKETFDGLFARFEPPNGSNRSAFFINFTEMESIKLLVISKMESLNYKEAESEAP